jgi:hypothetical protein
VARTSSSPTARLGGYRALGGTMTGSMGASSMTYEAPNVMGLNPT